MIELRLLIKSTMLLLGNILRTTACMDTNLWRKFWGSRSKYPTNFALELLFFHFHFCSCWKWSNTGSICTCIRVYVKQWVSALYLIDRTTDQLQDLFLTTQTFCFGHIPSLFHSSFPRHWFLSACPSPHAHSQTHTSSCLSATGKTNTHLLSIQLMYDAGSALPSWQIAWRWLSAQFWAKDFTTLTDWLGKFRQAASKPISPPPGSFPPHPSSGLAATSSYHKFCSWMMPVDLA